MDTKVCSEFGEEEKYKSGDVVRIWPIYKNPKGTVTLADLTVFPIKYRVRYVYEDSGVEYVEDFTSEQLTLVERRYTYYCNCTTKSYMHAKWCNTSPKSSST